MIEAVCIIPSCGKRAPASEPFCAHHRDRAPSCVNHLNRPSRTNLDGDELCQECADAWVRGEGQHAAWLEAQDAQGGR